MVAIHVCLLALGGDGGMGEMGLCYQRISMLSMMMMRPFRRSFMVVSLFGVGVIEIVQQWFFVGAYASLRVCQSGRRRMKAMQAVTIW